MRVTIDRIEGSAVTLIGEDGKAFTAPAELFEKGAEGDVFDIIKNEDETKNQKERINKLVDEMWE